MDSNNTQTLQKLLGFHWTEDWLWPDFADIKYDYAHEFYRSYSSFISQCPRTRKFCGVRIYKLIHEYLNTDNVNEQKRVNMTNSIAYAIQDLGPFYLQGLTLIQNGLTLIPAWISNYSHYKVWDEINTLFLNFNSVSA